MKDSQKRDMVDLRSSIRLSFHDYLEVVENGVSLILSVQENH